MGLDEGRRKGRPPGYSGLGGRQWQCLSYFNQLRKRHAKASFEFTSSGVTVVPVAPCGVWDIGTSI